MDQNYRAITAVFYQISGNKIILDLKIIKQKQTKKNYTACQLILNPKPALQMN